MVKKYLAGAAPVITTAALATGLLAEMSFAADRSVALNKEIETLEPMKGIVFWPDQAKSQKDLQKSISLEFSYCLPCAVVKGKTDDKIDYDWSSFEKMLDDIASRGHQAIVRFRIEYPSATITNASGCTEKVKGATAVPNYIKANKSYTETYSENPGGDGPTYYADWSNKELLWFYKQFYTDFAAKYDKDPRIAFVQAGFGHWGEYHIYGTKLNFGVNFATKDYQAEFLTHLDSLFKETPWSISIDAADNNYTPVAGNKTLLGLNFGLFDDSFMHAEHDISQGNGDNERNWRDLGTDRWKTAPGGGEISYYTEKDQREFLNPAGLYGVTWEDAAAKYHMTYVIGNDAPEGSYATKERVYEASSYAGYKFEITGYAVNGISAAVRVKNIGIAPLYHNAYVTVNGVRSDKSLKGLLPGEEATFTVAGLTIGDSETPELTITGDKLLKGATIPYKANLSANAEVIEGLLDESGTTGIAGARSLTHDKGKATGNLGKSRATDLKGRNVPAKAAHGAYYPVTKR
ncbi:hypothetical protein SAMN05720472_1009 [Fibrobacter sp. UWR3]|uniref:hypothetical protein n=1 Tax=Fibrobacter sp. UWR3 TaxID=1896217 RepID=UPI0009201053|nr:hypothetical protein [Fibrobacter sp. UWR3]SHM33141.1 hypothetical protein SAMN05720472_1009 [Fibrobacter sp. UWR3]